MWLKHWLKDVKNERNEVESMISINSSRGPTTVIRNAAIRGYKRLTIIERSESQPFEIRPDGFLC